MHITRNTPQLREAKVILRGGGKKSTSYRTEGHAHSKQYLLQEGKRGTHSVLKFLHTSVAAGK